MRFKANTSIYVDPAGTVDGGGAYLEQDITNGLQESDWVNNSWTMSFWVFAQSQVPNGYQGQPYLFFTGSHFHAYHRRHSGHRITFQMFGVTTHFDPDEWKVNSADRWNHFLITWDATTFTIKIYHDNTEAASYVANSNNRATHYTHLGGPRPPFRIMGGIDWNRTTNTLNPAKNYRNGLFSQWSFHNKVLTASERSLLYQGIGYQDLSAQQKIDFSALFWLDFVNDFNSSQIGKNYEGGSSDYDFTPSDFSRLSLREGNFAKRINGRVGDRISEIISSDPDERIVTANTTSIDNLPRYKQAQKPNYKPIINFNQTNLTAGDGNASFQANQTSSHHLIADIPSG